MSPSMRVAVRLMLLVLVLLPAGSADAVPVGWDCYLPQGPVDCRALQNAYFQEPLLQHDEENAEFFVEVRAQRVQSSVQLQLTFRSVDDDGTRVVFREWLPSNLRTDAAVLRILGALHRGTAPYLEVSAPGKWGKDGLSLTLHDGERSKAAQASTEATPWFIEPRMWGNMSSEGLFSVDTGVGFELNYSTPQWRIRSFEGFSYRLLSTETDVGQVVADRLGIPPPWPDDDDDDDTSFEALGAWSVTTLVHTLYKGVSVGGRMLFARDPTDNQAFLARPQVGVEWIYKPWLEADGTNFGLRYQIGGEWVRFLRINERLRMQETFALHQLELFGALHLGRVDINLGAGAKSILDDIHYSSVFGNVSTTWRITDALVLRGSVRGAFRNALINAPKNASTNSLESFAGGGNFGDVTYRLNFSISYTFGNALLRRQDQRWRMGA